MWRQRRCSGSRRGCPRPAARQLTQALCRLWWPASARAQATNCAWLPWRSSSSWSAAAPTAPGLLLLLALCNLAGSAAFSGAVLGERVALREIATACPPAPKVAAACARGLVRRLQQQQQATAASGGSRRDDPTQLVAAPEVLLRSNSASSQEAAARAAADAGAVEALLQLGRIPGAAAGSAAAFGTLGCLVAAAEPCLRLPEAVVAAGGVEAALAQLRGPAAQEEEEQEGEGEEGEEMEQGAASGAAVDLLYYLMTRSKFGAIGECWLRGA
jgi:hypothetical protein